MHIVNWVGLGIGLTWNRDKLSMELRLTHRCIKEGSIGQAV